MPSDRVQIPKVDGPQTGGGAGWWTMVESGRLRIMLNCGDCGLHAGELLDHTIDPDGTVHASIACPREGCSWHAWGRLLGWNHGRKPAGESLPAPAP